MHLTHWAAEETIAFIEGADTTQPFFCMMSVFDPHNPHDQYPAEYAGRVDREVLRHVVPPAAGDAEVYALQQERARSYLGPAAAFTAEDIPAMRVGYYASLALRDDEVGRVLAALKRKGIADNYHAMPERGVPAALQLFDLTADPHEQ